MKLSQMSARMRDARVEAGLPQQQLADIVGVTRGAISQYEKGDNAPRAKKIAKIAQALGVTVHWLVDGNGDSVAEQHHSIAFIPRYNVECSAGAGVEVSQEHIEQFLALRLDWLRERGIDPSQCIAANVRGDSMTPELLQGDVVFINRAAAAPTGKPGIFVFRYLDEIMVKRLTRVPDGYIVASVNPVYPSYTIPAGDAADFNVLGRVFNVSRSY